ncbi:MAG TPA: alpha/beta hydrolase [Puia sp.]|jgi:acetyl esterase|nr:alpha/beta hydrolase [Puia sp.]
MSTLTPPAPVTGPTPVDYLSDEHLAPGVKEFLKIANAPGSRPIESLPIPAARQVLIDAQKAFNVDYSGIEESEKAIEANGFTIPLNIVRPAGVRGDLPVGTGGDLPVGIGGDLPAFIFVHGGGWVLGDYPTHRRLVRDLVVASGCAAVFVNYTLSPEAHYPQAIHEIYAAAKWVSEHGEEIGVDGGKLAVAGNSAGGNMAGATSLMASEKKGPHLRAQVLMWPVTDATFTEESYDLYGEGRFLTVPLMKWSWDQYTPNPEARKERHASLLNATIDELKGLPPTLIQVAENDILRDEGEAFGRRLLEAGVDATTIRYNGMIHDWGMLNGLANEPATRSLILHAAAHLRHHLI